MSSALRSTTFPMAARLVLTRADACVCVYVSPSLFSPGIFLGRGAYAGVGWGTCLIWLCAFSSWRRRLELLRTQTFPGSGNLESMLFASVLCWGIDLKSSWAQLGSLLREQAQVQTSARPLSRGWEDYPPGPCRLWLNAVPYSSGTEVSVSLLAVSRGPLPASRGLSPVLAELPSIFRAGQGRSNPSHVSSL